MKYMRLVSREKSSVLLYLYTFVCMCISCNINIGLETKEPNIYINELKSNVTDGDTLRTDSAHLVWHCEDEYKPHIECRYQVNFGKWSSWKNNFLSFNTHLDDGEYIFIVQARFMNLKTQNEKSVHFYVKALRSPAIYVFPRQRSFSSDTATLIIRGEHLPASYGIAITFSTDFPLKVNQLYGRDDPEYTFGFTNKKAFLMVLGGEPFRGDCDLMSLSVSGIAKDSSKIDIDSCEIWDSSGVGIDLETVRGGLLIRDNGSVF